MKRTEINETSNREMITISRAEYEAMQACLEAQRAELAEQNRQLDAKNAELAEQIQALTAELAEQNQKLAAELAQALLKNRWLMEQLKLNKRKLFRPDLRCSGGQVWKWKKFSTCELCAAARSLGCLRSLGTAGWHMGTNLGWHSCSCATSQKREKPSDSLEMRMW